MTTLDEKLLPFELENFIQFQREFSTKKKKNLYMGFREQVIGEVTDFIKKNVSILKLDHDNYQNSEIKKFIKKVEFMLVNFL